MEATASDPSVQQQFGMIVGIPNAGQVNALATLNIRGERSVTCRGDFDRHPSLGPLPPGAPPVCEFFRHLPDALERAAELDATYGRNPDLDEMPMYGVVFSFKDPFDTKDMRSTGGGDAAYDIDFPARDHVLVEQLRKKGAIIFAKAVNTEYNGRAGDPGGRHRARKGAALDARLSAQHLGRQSVQSLRHHARGLARLELGLGAVGQRQPGDGQPRRGDARLVPRPVQPQRGRADPAAQGDARLRRRRDRRRHLLRPQRHSLPHHRRLRQGARRAEGSRVEGYYDPRDPFTTVPRSSVLEHALCRATRRRPGTPGALRRHADRHHPRVDGLSARLEDRGADHHRRREGDQDRPRRQARRDAGRIVRPAVAARSRHRADDDRFPARRSPGWCRSSCRTCCSAWGRTAQPLFKEFAAAIVPTEFVPGKVFGSGTMQPIDYCVALAEGRIAAARQSRSRHRPAAGTRERPSASTSRST